MQSGENLAQLRAVRNEMPSMDAIEALDNYFLGVLSVHVPADVWKHSLEQAQECWFKIHGGGSAAPIVG